MSRKVDQIRLERVQDEKFFVCMENGSLYQIKDIKIIEGEIWIQAMDGRVYKDTDIMTISESGDHYNLRSWMKHNLNIE